jgi:hypothetical protein
VLRDILVENLDDSEELPALAGTTAEPGAA